ncbi:MAG TPA: flagellar biosynthetic protein FliP, partial [Thermodesulfobacterium commune]|nr:flagellar biosynthetic protein FliP [Thermodesulfobacterium commune]
PNQVLISLALFLTFFIMTPTFKAVYEQAFIPYLNKQIGDKEFLERAQKPFKDF